MDIEDKRILWNVSGHASQGQVLVALGPSGKCRPSSGPAPAIIAGHVGRGGAREGEQAALELNYNITRVNCLKTKVVASGFCTDICDTM